MTERRRLLAFAMLALLALLAPAPGDAAETCGGQLGDPIRILDPGDDESGIGGTGVAPAASEGEARPRLGGDEDDDSGIGGTGVATGESGIGGTGVATDDSGIGGTGVATDDSGIGGTGVATDESGIGGTGRAPGGVGLFGRAEPIADASAAQEGTRHGRAARVCVGGVEVAIPESLALESSGGVEGAAASRRLASGQLVFVEATRTAEGLVARRLRVADDGSGRIDARSDDGTLRVGDRVLRIGPDTARAPDFRDSDLAPGRWIAYQAQLGPGGELFATRVARGREGHTRAPDTALESELADRLLEATRSGRIDYAAVEGIVVRRDDRARVGRLELALPEPASDTLPRALRSGMRVRVGGRIEREGTLRILPPRPPGPKPRTGTPKPTDRPGRGDAVGEPPDRPAPDATRPPPRPVRPPAPRDAGRPAIRPNRPAVDRRLTR